FQHGKYYVVRIGSYEKILAPASTTTWTHLAFGRPNSVNQFYVNGIDYPDNTAAAQSAPTAASSSFLIGGAPGTTSSSPRFLFWGLIDEARFFSFNSTTLTPSTDFLINHIPRDLTWSGA